MHAIVFAALLSVEIATPQRSTISQSQIEAFCNGKSNLACTIFDEKTRLRTVPRMYLTSPHWMRHEGLHIADMLYSFRAYANETDADTFASRGECESHALEAIRRFPEALREFQRATTLLRDGR
ncbi:MAG: hypothetical protein DMF58_11360 [Acidobacteria bacterium]|nr:MAG: hypothetical protein DMF58_11360 [Acidobacteriota bacterium]